MNHSKEKAGEFLYQLSSYFFLAAAFLFVWARNHFYDFGVSSPMVKPSDVLLVLALGVFLLSSMLSRASRSDSEKNALIIFSTKIFFLFLFFLGLGLASRFVTFKISPTYEDMVELGRIVLGFIGFFLTLSFAFHNQRFAKLVFWSFLANIVLIPFLFFPIPLILKLLLVVSPVSYTFLGFQNSNIILGFSVMVTLALIFSMYKFTRPFWIKTLFFITCCLLAAILFWTNSRAGWLAAFAAMAAIAFIRKGGVKKIIFGIGEAALMFLLGFLVLPPLARNTAIVRVFPHLDVPATIDQHIFFQLPTTEFIKNDNLVLDVGFQAGRADIWRAYALHFMENPLGVGPAYYSVFNERNSYAQSVNAHNLWLQIAVSGGIGALAVIILIFIFAGKEAWRAARRRGDAVSVGLFGAFCGVLVEVTMIDSLELRWLWVFLGLVIAWGYNTKIQPSPRKTPPIS